MIYDYIGSLVYLQEVHWIILTKISISCDKAINKVNIGDLFWAKIKNTKYKNLFQKIKLS